MPGKCDLHVFSSIAQAIFPVLFGSSKNIDGNMWCNRDIYLNGETVMFQ